MHIIYSIYQYIDIRCILSTSHILQCEEVYQPMSPVDNFANAKMQSLSNLKQKDSEGGS